MVEVGTTATETITTMAVGATTMTALVTAATIEKMATVVRMTAVNEAATTTAPGISGRKAQAVLTPTVVMGIVCPRSPVSLWMSHRHAALSVRNRHLRVLRIGASSQRILHWASTGGN